MPKHCRDRLGDGFDAGEPPRAGHAASEIAFVGRDDVHAARAQHLDIFLRGRVLPHVDVHCRSDDHGGGGGEIERGEEIVGDAARQLGQHVRGGRRDHQGIDALGDGDMLDGAFDVGGAGRVLAAKQIGDYFLPGQRGEGQRRDKFLRAARHHHLHVDAVLLQAAHQFGGLVGRHASAYAECDSHGSPLPAPFRRRRSILAALASLSCLAHGNLRRLVLQLSGVQLFHGDARGLVGARVGQQAARRRASTAARASLPPPRMQTCFQELE